MTTQHSQQTSSQQNPQVTIDYQALSHNASLAQSLSPQARLLCVVKANGYGHGMLEVANALDGVADGWGVARIDEGITLRRAGFRQPIVVMSALLGENSGQGSALMACKEHQLTPVLHDQQMFIRQWQCCLELGINFWVKVDTGMHRLGLSAEFARQHFDKLQPENVVITHFASADASDCEKFTEQNRAIEELFTPAQREDNKMNVSVANSARLARQEQDNELILAPTNGVQWIRPGIMLYGSNPLDSETDISRQLQPVMTFTAPVIAIREIPAGETVGYNGTWRADRPSIIATIGAGYADGYPRHARNGTPVVIHGEQASLAGRVSMDMITVDVTDIVDAGKTVSVGDSTVLWGSYPTADAVAECTDTISYELFTGIGNRVERSSINR